MNTPVCKLCRSDALEAQYSYSDYDLLRCKKCGFGMLEPMPSIDPGEFYHEDYYRGTLEEGVGFDVLDDEALSGARNGMLGKIDWLLSKRKIDSFLDVGCGVGLLVEAASMRKIKARGVDVSHFAVEYGGKDLGITGLLTGELGTVIEKGTRFDIVYLNHVIEHVPDPVSFVQECMTYVAPGGWLVLETPDIDSSEARRDGKDWRFILHEHLYYFSLSTLARLCESQGMIVRFAEKEVGSTGALNTLCGGEDKAREFYDRWLKNTCTQFIIRLVRKLYARAGQRMDVDYKFIKIVAEKR